MTYASIAELKAFGLSGSISDAVAIDALELADEIINDHTDTAFGAETVATKTVLGRPGRPIVLPRPFRDITSVSVNGQLIDSSSYVVDDVGLTVGRYYRDADGYIATSPLSLVFTGVTVPVKVTGTFGYGSVPRRVKRAALLLALGFTQPSSSEASSTVKSLSVEGYSITYRDNLAGLDTTGNDEADRLLAGFAAKAHVL